MRLLSAIMQDINWSDYQTFLAIARAGQLTRAAHSAGVDATTLGRRLRRLESQLGSTLFEQTREGQVLTPAGEALLASVEQMARAAAMVDQTDPRVGLNGHVRISVSEGFGSWVVARHLGDFAVRHPGLTVDLVASNGFLSPSRREADIAVMLSRPKTGPLIARKLTDYVLRLYASPTYLAGHPPITAPADLVQHRLVGYIPDLLYAPELNYLADLHPGLTASLRSSSILAQHHLLTTGSGVGVLPCFIGDADPALVRVAGDHAIVRSFWLVMHKDTHTLQRNRVCAEWLDQVVRIENRALSG